MNERWAMRWVPLLMTLLVVSLSFAIDPPSPATPEKPQTAIQLAIADETLSFTPQGQPLFPNATAPDLVRLPNGHLLAAMDIVAGDTTTLSVARSTDDGETWSSPKPIRISNMPPEVTGACHGSFVLTSQGLLRLYFTSSINEQRRGRVANIIGSALSRDGRTYFFDPQVRIDARYRGTLTAEAVAIDTAVLLFVTETESPDRTRREPESIVTIFHSADGRRFQPMNRMRESIPICDVISGRQRDLRLFHTTPEGIASMISHDGRRWEPEKGLRIAGGNDAAILEKIARRDAPNQLLMLCCIQPGKPIGKPTYADETESNTNENSADWQPFTDSVVDDSYINSEQWDDQLPPSFTVDSFTDYIQWAREHLEIPEDFNAYHAYTDVLASMDASTVDSPFNNCLDSDDWVGGPVPWDPAAYPQWEASYRNNFDWTESFRAAAIDPRAFRSPLNFGDSDTPPEDRCLVQILMPHFAKMRGLAKATLANGWRMENGAVPPDSMRESWETVLGNARQLRGDWLTIGALVSLAEQRLVEENARSALQWNIFDTEEELAAALQTLEDNDPPWESKSGWVKGECAMVMDLVQYPLQRSSETGEMTLDQERLLEAYRMGWGEESTTPEEQAELAKLTVDDFTEAVVILEDYGRQQKDLWDSDYSQESLKESGRLDTEMDQFDNPVAKRMAGSLHRAYVLMMRGEASRRATQLSYGIHLFKKRNGRWPTSLDELSDTVDPDVMIDPHSQERFRYYPTEDGNFMLYSVQVNGVDDGGFHNPDGRTDSESEADDYVYWPLQD